MSFIREGMINFFLHKTKIIKIYEYNILQAKLSIIRNYNKKNF